MGCVVDIPLKNDHRPRSRACEDELWPFSLAFYERPAIAEALVDLQEEAGLDVNLILFAIWVGLSGRGSLDERDLKVADQAIRTMRVDVIEPLRQLRRRLKPAPDAGIQRLRDKIKAPEIDAEKAAQERLAALVAPASKSDFAERLADAEANFALYLQPAAAQSKTATIIRDELRRFVDEPLSPRSSARPSV